MAGPASDYHRGEMDISEQRATYKLVMSMTKWGSLYTAAILLFLSLWFAAGVGFLGSLFTTVVVIVIGTLLLREKKSSGH